jgi:hypothetical protein
MLPGTYQLAVQGVEFRILLRRHPRTGIPNAVPFWGLGEPPAVPRVAADGRTPAVEAGAASRAFEA